MQESLKNKVIHDIYRHRFQRGTIAKEQLDKINSYADEIYLQCETKGDLVKLLELFCNKNDIPTHQPVNRRYHPVKINIYDDCFGVIANNTENEFFFDLEFLPLLEGKGWHEDRLGYLVRMDGVNDGQRATKYKTLFAHHIITGKPQKRTWHTDHIDGNKKNNRKDNLRIVPATINSANSKIPKNNTSGFKGVHFHKAVGRWCAVIGSHNQVISLGYYDTARDAATAYDAVAKIIYGDYALTNIKQGLL